MCCGCASNAPLPGKISSNACDFDLNVSRGGIMACSCWHTRCSLCASSAGPKTRNQLEGILADDTHVRLTVQAVVAFVRRIAVASEHPLRVGHFDPVSRLRRRQSVHQEPFAVEDKLPRVTDGARALEAHGSV